MDLEVQLEEMYIFWQSSTLLYNTHSMNSFSVAMFLNVIWYMHSICIIQNIVFNHTGDGAEQSDKIGNLNQLDYQLMACMVLETTRSYTVH